MKHQIYIECGCCGDYHREDYYGDCRNDDERFIFDELIAMGVDDRNIVDLEPELNEEQHKPDEKLIATYFNFSPIRNLTAGEILDPFFSRFACQTCGSTLYGNRHYCSATIGRPHTGPREKLEICTDCFQYFFG